MKKLIFFFLAIHLQVHAQFFEGFEGATFPPSGWVVADNGIGTNSSWSLNTNYHYEGNNSARISRENIGTSNTSEDWLITPAIVVSVSMPLNFYIRHAIIGNRGSLFQIRVSTTSQTDQNSFTTINGWNDDDFTTNFQLKTTSLDTYIGQTIYIAFVKINTQIYASTSGNTYYIDNVTIGTTNLINGTIQYSETGTCDANATPLENAPIIVQSNTNSDIAFSNLNGYYQNTSLQNNFTITPNTSVDYFTIIPNNYTFNFSSIGNVGNANFCFIPNGIHHDLEVSLLPRNNSKAGFTANYVIIYKNKGNQIESGTITLNYNNTILQLSSTYPNVNSQTIGNLTWNFTNLKLFESRKIYFSLRVNSNTDTPPVAIGDILNYTAIVSNSETDETPNDNNSILNQSVVASSDPNDKIVTEGSILDIAKVGDYLHYVIRFQNIGNSDATNVIVRDILAENLDVSTLQIIASSHQCRSTLTNGNHLEFSFNNINLPSSISNEPASSGYVAFKIKPSSSVGVGSVINNTANIYFDFNYPILTNTTSTTFSALSSESFKTNYFSLIPNPVNNNVSIKNDFGIFIQSITIYNTLGQLVKTELVSDINSPITLNVASLKTGTYFITIQSEKGKTVEKFIKL